MVDASATLLQKVKLAIERVGARAVFYMQKGGAYNPNPADGSPQVSGETTIEIAATVSPPIAYRQAYQSSDDMSKSATAQVYVPASGLGFEPVVGMRLSLAGKSWRVDSVTKHVFHETALVFELAVTNG